MAAPLRLPGRPPACPCGVGPGAKSQTFRHGRCLAGSPVRVVGGQPHAWCGPVGVPGVCGSPTRSPWRMCWMVALSYKGRFADVLQRPVPDTTALASGPAASEL